MANRQPLNATRTTSIGTSSAMSGILIILTGVIVVIAGLMLIMHGSGDRISDALEMPKWTRIAQRLSAQTATRTPTPVVAPQTDIVQHRVKQ
jgi:sulfite exporter TauE/SafE